MHEGDGWYEEDISNYRGPGLKPGLPGPWQHACGSLCSRNSMFKSGEVAHLSPPYLGGGGKDLEFKFMFLVAG